MKRANKMHAAEAMGLQVSQGRMQARLGQANRKRGRFQLLWSRTSGCEHRNNGLRHGLQLEPEISAY